MSQRVLTAPIGIPLGLLLIYLGGWPLTVAVALLAVLGMHEWFRLTGIEERRIGLAGALGALLLVVLAYLLSRYLLVGAGLVALLAVLSIATPTRSRPPSSLLGQFTALLVGWIYIPFLLGFLLQLRALEALRPLPDWLPSGAAWLFLVMACCWVVDSAAYFVGRAFGRHTLAPTISPGKTIEGGIAGLLAAVAWTAGIGMLLGLSVKQGLLLGLLLGLGGELGDLFESLLKRRAGVKDSGDAPPRPRRRPRPLRQPPLLRPHRLRVLLCYHAVVSPGSAGPPRRLRLTRKGPKGIRSTTPKECRMRGVKALLTDLSRPRYLLLMLLLAGLGVGGAWLWVHDRPLRVTGATLEFIALGDVDRTTLDNIARDTGQAYHLPFRVLPSATPLPPAAYLADRRQYRSDRLLDLLPSSPARRVQRLYVTEAHVTSPGMNFLFGQSRPEKRLAVMSLARFRLAASRPQAPPEALRRQVAKIAMHELGHSFGFDHCPNPRSRHALLRYDWRRE